MNVAWTLRPTRSTKNDSDPSSSDNSSGNESIKTFSPREREAVDTVMREANIRLDKDWKKFLSQWNQPMLRYTIAECIPDLVGLIWHEEFAQLASSPYSFNSENITTSTAERNAVCATQQLIHTLLNRTRMTATTLLLALFFAHRYQCHPKTKRGSYGSQYRMYIVCLLLAHKYTEDHPFSNRVWAQLSKLPTGHINAMERDFLQHIEHRLAVCLIDFQRWVVALDRKFGWTLITTDRRREYRALPLPPTPRAPIVNEPIPAKLREQYHHHLQLQQQQQQHYYQLQMQSYQQELSYRHQRQSRPRQESTDTWKSQISEDNDAFNEPEPPGPLAHRRNSSLFSI